jgi:hypothetical protein
MPKPPYFRLQAQKDETMCYRKKQFATLAEAKRASGGGYKCPICGAFHSSSRAKKKNL